MQETYALEQNIGYGKSEESMWPSGIIQIPTFTSSLQIALAQFDYQKLLLA